MRYKWILLFSFWVLPCWAHGDIHVPGMRSTSQIVKKERVIKPYKMDRFDEKIEMFYQKLKEDPPANFTDKLVRATAFFMHKPYLLGALGEGEKGQYDQNPLYRTDRFDCVTYVSTVLALAEADSLAQFKQIIIKIRYRDGMVRFINRNHFASVDWNPVNIQNGFIRDITEEVSAQTSTAKAKINKPAWFRHLSIHNLALLKPLPTRSMFKRYQQLRDLAKQVKEVDSEMQYIPLTFLFKRHGNQIAVNKTVFDHIPEGAIVEIVRANWDLTRITGTHLNISHLGFVVAKRNRLFYRSASSRMGRVIDYPLIDYLKLYYLNMQNPDKIGITIFEVVEATPNHAKQHFQN